MSPGLEASVTISCQDCSIGRQYVKKIEHAPMRGGVRITPPYFNLATFYSKAADALDSGSKPQKISMCDKNLGKDHIITRTIGLKNRWSRNVQPATAKQIYDNCGGAGPFEIQAVMPWKINVSIAGGGTARVRCDCLDCECKSCNGKCGSFGTSENFQEFSEQGTMNCTASYMLCAETANPFIFKTNNRTYTFPTCNEAERLFYENKPNFTLPSVIADPKYFFPPKTGSPFPPVGSFSYDRSRILALSAEQQKFIDTGRAKGWSDSKIVNEWKLLQSQKNRAAVRATATPAAKIAATFPRIGLRIITPSTCNSDHTTRTLNWLQERLFDAVRHGSGGGFVEAANKAKNKLQQCKGAKCYRYISGISASGGASARSEVSIGNANYILNEYNYPPPT